MESSLDLVKIMRRLKKIDILEHLLLTKPQRLLLKHHEALWVEEKIIEEEQKVPFHKEVKNLIFGEEPEPYEHDFMEEEKACEVLKDYKLTTDVDWKLWGGL